MLQTQKTVEVIPAARRLITSLRDMGYELTTAVADLVDNSIEAGATTVTIDIEFEGEDSWVRISDNGAGMTSSALREAMRYGSSRQYSDADLGKFGLGLKVASLSQCRRLSVASRTNRDRAEVSSYCWDLGHVERTNRWELIPVLRDADSPPMRDLLKNSVGTVVLWQRLDRILGYQHPAGESARRRLAAMRRDLEGHLAMVFHRHLSGEAGKRRELRIIVNGSEIRPWDPFARDEPATKRLDPVTINIDHGDGRGELVLEPFVLPHQSEFSSIESFRRAGGPTNWNQQQGFYIYRSNRLIQSGGWCRIRSVDEHTKLARVAFRFSPQLDDAFRVNVSKMRVELPTGMRDQITRVISPVTKLANDRYRRVNGKSGNHHSGIGPGRQLSSSTRLTFEQAVKRLLSVADVSERSVIRRVVARLSAN